MNFEQEWRAANDALHEEAMLAIVARREEIVLEHARELADLDARCARWKAERSVDDVELLEATGRVRALAMKFRVLRGGMNGGIDA